MTFETLFGHMHEVTLAQECARGAAIFVFGLVMVRVAGRRAFGKWGALDIVVSIVIGSNLSRAMTGAAPFVGTLLASALIMALHYVFALGAARFPPLSRLFEGSAVDIGRANGILHGARIRHAVSHADIDEALRGQGIDDVGDAKRIVLEPSGKITVLKCSRRHAPACARSTRFAPAASAACARPPRSPTGRPPATPASARSSGS